MRSFVDLDERLERVPAEIVQRIARIERAAGAEDRYRNQTPALLETLAHRARIESIRASSAIEDIVVEQRRLERIVRGSMPRTRSEAEVAGYRDALDYVIGADPAFEFGVSDLLRVHRLLFAPTDTPGGTFKAVDNRVVDTLDDGRKVDRFLTVPARQTDFYISELHHRFAETRSADRHHPILLTGLYILDLLVIHPFDNGNGRTARLATTALLRGAGFEVVRYVAVEGLVDRTSGEYYATLKASTERWHDGRHDVWPWLGYLVARIEEGYRDFDRLVQAARPAGNKSERVERQILELGDRIFTRDDVRAALPDVGDATITRVLRSLRDSGRILLIESGTNARWERVDP